MQLYMSDIPTITPDDDYSEVKECDYKDEHYSVRDNGAIMRHSREGKPIRKDDNVWTFGKKDDTTGYMLFCGARVHIIVATAFYGEHDSKVYVVDHKDTNRCNNRPDNLRWLTKLENVLNNPVTLKRITYLCGGDIQKFIENPACIRDLTGTNSDLMWMRTVSSEEAKAAYERTMAWANKPLDETPSHGGKLGDWIYRPQYNEWLPNFSKRDKPNEPAKETEKHAPQTVADLKFSNGHPVSVWNNYHERGMLYDIDGNLIGPKPLRQEKKELTENNVSRYFETSNKLAQQLGWRPYTNPEFPCCPKDIATNPIQEYATQLIEGKVFVSATYGNSMVYKYTIHDNQLLVITKIPNGVKSFGLARVTWNGKAFIHESMGTFFQEDGAMAAFTRAQGLAWNGPESIDEYC